MCMCVYRCVASYAGKYGNQRYSYSRIEQHLIFGYYVFWKKGIKDRVTDMKRRMSHVTVLSASAHAIMIASIFMPS